jgi:hypothetical protein
MLQGISLLPVRDKSGQYRCFAGPALQRELLGGKKPVGVLRGKERKRYIQLQRHHAIVDAPDLTPDPTDPRFSSDCTRDELVGAPGDNPPDRLPGEPYIFRWHIVQHNHIPREHERFIRAAHTEVLDSCLSR